MRDADLRAFERALGELDIEGIMRFGPAVLRLAQGRWAALSPVLSSAASASPRAIGGSYPRPGRYLERIDRTRLTETIKGECAVVDAVVVERIEPVPAAYGEGGPHDPGARVVHLFPEWSYGSGERLRRFVAVALGLAADAAVDEATLERAFGPEQTLTGVVLETENREILLRSGRPFVASDPVKRHRDREGVKTT